MLRVIENFKIELDPKEVLRLLGHTSKGRGVKKSSVKLIQEMMELSSVLIKPKGIYIIKKSNQLKEECLFDTAEKVAFCICTIGDRLEKEVKNLSSKGELTRAVILDAIGSVCAESTAEYLASVIEAEAKKKKLYSGMRFSPGYGGWKLQGQTLIFDSLPSDKIGVFLNRSFMMNPRKSVSFAVNLSKKPFKDKKTPCQLCGLTKCRFKK